MASDSKHKRKKKSGTKTNKIAGMQNPPPKKKKPR